MLLGEPSRNQFDWHFRLLGFPIRVTPWFWLASLLLGWNASKDMDGNSDPKVLATWVIAVFASILVHELGHALAFRRYGLSASVVLYHFGGLAIPDNAFGGYARRRSESRFEQIIISGAGPAAQLAVALVIIIGLLLAGKFVPLGGFVGHWLYDIVFRLNLSLDQHLGPEPLVKFLAFFLYVSVYWALLNLLPIYPLDGGQITRELFLLGGRNDAIRYSLILSMIAGGLTAFWGFSTGNTYLGILFGMLAYGNYTALQAYLGSGGFRRP